MNKFKLFSVLTLSLLFSSCASIAYEIKATCDFCCGTSYKSVCGNCDYLEEIGINDWCPTRGGGTSLVCNSFNYFSPDNKFCIYIACELCDDECWRSSLVVENVSQSRDIFEFVNTNILSFAFSKDSKYILVERSEYNSQAGVQNEFIEVFDLVNEKRIFYMPFIKRFCSADFRDYKYSIDDLVFLNFSGDTLKSVEWDFEGRYINVPASIQNVDFVYASQLGLGLSVRFNDGTIGVYLPKKDFSRLELLSEFCAITAIGQPVFIK